jgi:hypothetical protein
MFASKISRSPASFDSRARPEFRDVAALLGQSGLRPSNEGRHKQQAGVSEPPRFSWNIGNVALHASDIRSQPNSSRGGGAGAARHAGSFPRRLQAKLEVGAVDDPLEREADHAAEQVMRMPDMGPAALPALRNDGLAGVQRKADAPYFSSRGLSSAGSRMAAPPSVHEVLSSQGQPLAPVTRAFFEPRFGHDFSRVRIHDDKAAQTSAASIDAQAYTVGHHVAFGTGRFAPQTPTGRALLAHELAHVVQQGEAAQFQVAPQRQTDQKLGATEIGAISPPRTLSMLSTGVARKVIQRQVVDPRKLQIISIDTPRHVRVSEWLNETTPNGPSRSELYWVDFEVDAKGVMRASVRTVSPDRAYRSGVLKFGDEFRRAVEHFDSNGVELKTFEGDWSYMTPTEISENLKVFKEGMEKGQTREQAAAGTPSGKVAKKSGFVVENVENDPQSQPHLADEGMRRWRVKATFRRVTPSEAGGSGTTAGTGGSTAGGKGGGTVVADDAPTAGRTGATGTTPAKPSTPGGTTAGGAKPSTGTVVEHEGGGTMPAPKTTGKAPQTGRSGGVAIGIGAGAAAMVLSFVAAYFKGKADKKISDKQIAAFLEIARKKINANPDDAVKKMMVDPYKTVYAWIHLDSAVISTFGTDSATLEPSMSDSSPLFDLGPIEYMTGPVDPALIPTVPRISTGAGHATTVRTTIVGIPLDTPPIEDMISYAKGRSLPLDDIYAYVSSRHQDALSSSLNALQASQKIQEALKSQNEVFKKLQADFEIAKKLKDVALQKSIADRLTSVAQGTTHTAGLLHSMTEILLKTDKDVRYWERIMNLIKPTTPRP